tara:strand:+ start:20060 stop:21529 length:1470 start_codon:yes stop_codon:yes gene_type:complete
MTATFITSTSVVSGIAHSFTADGDSFYLQQGILWGSTNANMFSGSFYDDVSIVLAGDAVQANNTFFSGDRVNLTITATGSVTNFDMDSTQATFQITGADSSITNHGSIIAQKAIGLFSSGGTSTITNTGNIEASSGVFISYAGVGDTFYNSGTVQANNYDDDLRDSRHNNGVVALRSDSTIVNYEGGVISAMSSEGAGIKVMQSANNSIVLNHGDVHSVQAWGVDFGELNASNLAVLVNTGTISGGAGSFLGSISADVVDNSGTMIGDVALNDGDDSYTATNAGVVLGWINGEAGNDTLTGGDNADFIDGGADNDRLFGRGGDDDLRGGLGSDFMSGGTGDDQLIGDDGADKMFGGSGDDTLNGGRDQDTIRGGDGNDEINGGRLADVLRGGAGADTFLYTFKQDSSTGASDTIQDFEVGIDVIDLSAVASGLTFVGTAAFSGTGNEVRYDIDGSGKTFVQVDTDANGSADMRIWLTDVGALSADDFVL